MNQYRPGGFQFFPPAIKNLMIINGLFFLASISLQQAYHYNLDTLFGLPFMKSENFKPFQIITYMFMHSKYDFGHIFFNMFALWMFGRSIEQLWGTKKFLIYYFSTGIGAVVLHQLIAAVEIGMLTQTMSPEQVNIVMREGFEAINKGMNYTNPLMAQLNGLLNGPLVGASGAVFGILLAAGMLFPNDEIYFYFLIPIKMKYFVILYGVAELIFGLQNNAGDNVAHFAHLGGMVFGFFIIRYWKQRGELY